MARVLQLRRGTTAENDLFTGAVGELTMDTTTNELRIHDGSTVGGNIIGADKLDLDTGNATASTKETIVGWCTPDFSAAVSITPGSTEKTYTCPKAGFVIFSAGGFNNAYSYLKVNGTTINNATTTGNSYITNVFASTIVDAGDVCTFKDSYESTKFGMFFVFFPFKGV